jgi:hypothetical protein
MGPFYNKNKFEIEANSAKHSLNSQSKSEVWPTSILVIRLTRMYKIKRLFSAKHSL